MVNFANINLQNRSMIKRLATRGRSEDSRSNTSGKMIMWITLFGLLAVTFGAPLEDESAKNVSEPIIEATAIPSTTNDIEGFAIDGEILPSTKAPSVAVVFIDIPKHTETELGSSVLLPCRTGEPVNECQWSWQPLPPTHLPLPDTNEHPSSTNASSETVMNETTPTTPQSLPVRLFPAFGNNSNDCSVRFSSTKHEQTGFWTCAARRNSADPFTSTEPAKLSIFNGNPETTVTFVKTESAVESPAGSSAQIMCRTESPVKECQWSWRQLNQSQQWNLEVKKFPAFGNDSTDCSIKFKNVLPEQEGLWTCGARANDEFIQSSPVKFLISEVEFVQLSRGIQIAAGESAFLRCLVNKPVVQCEWSWRSTNSSHDANVVKKFPPNTDAEHDCSVRFKNVLHEEEGLWTCGVRLTSNGFLHEAPPATVTLLPSAKINFAESPENTVTQIGTKATLKCVTNGRVDTCAWMWRPLTGTAEATVVKEFPSSGDLGRDCSLNLPRATSDEQGFWSCRVSVSSLNTILTSASAKLTVYEQDAVKFSELSKDIQISSGGSVLLRCVTTSAVEQCRWSLTPVNSNTTVVVKQFPAAGDEARDCSVRLSHALAEQEGLWTCGAKIHGQGNYTDAPPAKLSLLEPALIHRVHNNGLRDISPTMQLRQHPRRKFWVVTGSREEEMVQMHVKWGFSKGNLMNRFDSTILEAVTVALWSHPHQKVILACAVKRLPEDADCEWIHEPDVRIRQNDGTRKDGHTVQLNISTGLCTLQFNPNPSDLGLWTCKFSVATENGRMDLRNSSLVLLNTIIEDSMLGWIVGAVTSIILLLMILTVTLVVCRGRLFVRRPLPILETASASHNKNLSPEDSRMKNEYTTTAGQDLSNAVLGKETNFYESVVSYHDLTLKL